MTVGNITQVKLPAMIYLTGVGPAWRTGRRGAPAGVASSSTTAIPSAWTSTAPRVCWTRRTGSCSRLAGSRSSRSRTRCPRSCRLPDPAPARVEFEVKLPERYQRQMQQRPIQRAPRTDAREVGGTIHHYGITERCRGDCSRGGEGPACGKLGCTG